MTIPAFLVPGEDDLSKGNLDQIPQRLVKMTKAGTIRKKLLKKVYYWRHFDALGWRGE